MLFDDLAEEYELLIDRIRDACDAWEDSPPDLAIELYHDRIADLEAVLKILEPEFKAIQPEASDAV